MSTFRDLATDALGDIGVLAVGEVMDADKAAHALRKANDLMDQWAAERMQIPNIVRTTATLTPNQASFTVGSGGNINIVRPVFFTAVNFVDTAPSPDIEYPLAQLTDAAWAATVLKDLTSTLPRAYFYNPTFGSTGRGTLYPWPVPTNSGLLWAVYAPTALVEFASLDTTISLPPAYRRMIIKNLAVELAPAYEKEVSGLLAAQARESLGTVKRSNTRLADMSFPADSLMGNIPCFDIRTGR